MDLDTKLLLETQDCINFNGINIYQPTLKDIREIGFNEFNKLIMPFALIKDVFNISDDKYDSVNIFDILVLDENLDFLTDSIIYFCHTHNISFDTVKHVLYIDEGMLDRNNFDRFSDIILRINAKEKMVFEKQPNNLTAVQLDIWEKIQDGRKKEREKSQIQLYDMINVCQFIDYYIPIKTICSWTLFNIARCYQTKLGYCSYNDAFQIYCVSGDSKIINHHHWLDITKI